jgi:hypothetical protein
MSGTGDALQGRGGIFATGGLGENWKNEHGCGQGNPPSWGV